MTVRINEEAYTAIKRFASYSPSGLTAADFIRALVQTFGDYCQEKLKNGQVASSADMGVLSKLIVSSLEPKESSNV